MLRYKKNKQCDVKQLKCSCQYTDVFGLPCVHAMVVAETFKPLWKEITHNDVSVRWWKKYYLFSLPDKVIPNTVKQGTIKQVFQALRKHETVGIHVKESYFKHIPIDTSDLTQEYFHSPHVVRCNNYPDSHDMDDFDPFSSDMDATMSQVVNINTQMTSEDEDGIFSFVNDDPDPNLKRKNNFYSQLKPNFTEVVNWISNQEEVDEFSKLMDSFVSGIKEKYEKEHNVDTNHTYVSSNIPIEKSKKHHGCDGWKQSSRKKRK